MPLPPLAQDLPAAARQILERATRHETPFEGGRMVWHAWGDGEPLVLLHGGSGSWAHWARNVEPLAAAGRRVLAADLPGFGDSDAVPGGHDVDALVEPVAQGIRALVGDAPCDVAGFSFGGMLAGLVAAAHPARVRRLVIVGAPGLGLRAQRLPLVAWRHLDDPAAHEAAHRKNLARLMLHDEAKIDALALGIQAANTARDRLQRRKLAMTDLLARTLPTLGMPIAAIYGENDALYTDVRDELAQLLRAVPGMQEVVFIAGAGHWVPYEAPEAFNAALLRVLGD